jgi:hypothetical protein
MEKFLYKAQRYDSKLELMFQNNLTPDQYKSLLSMGRIQKTTDDEYANFAGVHLTQNKYKYNGVEYRDMEHVCKANGFSRRKYSMLRKLGHIKSINNQNVESDGRSRRS